MSLFIGHSEGNSVGSGGRKGPDLVALHGWGMHGAVWAGVAAVLGDDYRVRTVDLPGFGQSPPAPGQYALEAQADALLAAVVPGTAPSERPILMGWSMGGMIALAAAARYPERVGALVLVAAGPRFPAGSDWPHGADPNALDVFAETVRQDPRGALTRFLILQAGQDKTGREVAKRIRAELFRYGMPDPEALAEGLRLLRETDLRPVLPTVACPRLFILGGRDTLLGPGLADDIRALCPACRVVVLPRGGHALFLSHQTDFIREVKAFLHDIG